MFGSHAEHTHSNSHPAAGVAGESSSPRVSRVVGWRGIATLGFSLKTVKGNQSMIVRLGLIGVFTSVVLSPAFAGEAEYECVRYSYFFGKRAALKLDYDEIRKTPKWDMESPNPPISAKHAVELANPIKIRVLKDTPEFHWELESVSLRPLDPRYPDNELNKNCWYWLVTYEAYPLLFSGPQPKFEVAVLLDGTLVRPTISDFQSQVGPDQWEAILRNLPEDSLEALRDYLKDNEWFISPKVDIKGETQQGPAPDGPSEGDRR